ncbi:helix-turn-helix domain-containing protein [Sporolactobacillus pectinivorans]|uniref:helix-turn-helix domain-containing protein n=1 Tax=Sporolactobacillus pectinivorans TaxID=1591408 RepID=UPI0012FE3BFE|nr:helix-turn-helix transcriptional regulator [Sporolactobacillus pectinivorans]
MTIGERLQNQRKKLGYTQQEIAGKLHVSRQTISNWEVGKNYPDLQSIVDLSDIYNISLDLLLKGDENVMEKLKHDTDVVKANRLVATSNFIGIILALSLILIGGVERIAFGNWIILIPSALILLSIGSFFTKVKSNAGLNISCLIIGIVYLLLEFFTYIV